MLPTGECTKCSGDNKAPTIKLKGSSTITLNVGETYIELGATAEDDIDGDLTSKIEISETSETLDTSKAGTYTITYTVKDSNDNVAKVTRKVVVKSTTTKPTEDNKTDDKNDNKEENKTTP